MMSLATLTALLSAFASAVTAVLSFMKTKIVWSADWAATLSGLRLVWGVVQTSYRQPSVLILWGMIALGGYLFGHLEEARKWSASAAVVKEKSDKALAQSKAETKAAQAEAVTEKALVAKLAAELQLLQSPRAPTATVAPLARRKAASKPFSLF